MFEILKRWMGPFLNPSNSPSPAQETLPDFPTTRVLPRDVYGALTGGWPEDWHISHSYSKMICGHKMTPDPGQEEPATQFLLTADWPREGKGIFSFTISQLPPPSPQKPDCKVADVFNKLCAAEGVIRDGNVYAQVTMEEGSGSRPLTYQDLALFTHMRRALGPAVPPQPPGRRACCCASATPRTGD